MRRREFTDVAFAAASPMRAHCRAVAAGTQATAFPIKPIRLIVSFPAGSAIDGLERVVADRMAITLNQRVLVEPMPEASTVVAMQYVIRQPADGYTMLAVSASAAIKSVVKEAPFDSKRPRLHRTVLRHPAVPCPAG